MSTQATQEALVSILDNDLYKFTMQYAVLQHYKDAQVVYQFTNRDKRFKLNEQAVDWLRKQIKGMSELRLTDDEYAYVRNLPFFDTTYADYLAAFRFHPDTQVAVDFDTATQELSLSVTGLWHETILYEVPLLALISEAYFKFVDQDWNYDGQHEKARNKSRVLIDHGCKFSEFGTRRRRDHKTHDIVMAGICEAVADTKQPSKGGFSGTSNVYFARKYNVAPIGTVAHEFFMGVSALEGVQHANRVALEKWLETFKGGLSIALTDTFTTGVFLRDFQHDLASRCIAVRQDSGDPKAFVSRMIDHYKAVGVDPKTKFIVFSDGLNVNRALELQRTCDEAGIGASFGIGTTFTNDFQRASDPSQTSQPMNIVIKMHYCNGKRVIKLSDDTLKHSASKELVSQFEHELGIA